MELITPKFGFRDVVLVADVATDARNPQSVHLRRNLEMTDAETLSALRNSMSALGLNVHHYNSPDELALNAHKHKLDIVMTLYGGERSRNRMALVPAVCEAFGLRFIGPDVYGRIFAQDKEVSKRIAIDCGLVTPAWRVIRHEVDLGKIGGLLGPVVVKPLWEGSSIGISERNLCGSLEQAREVAAELLRTFTQPALVEAFVRGREVAYSRIQGRCDAWAFSEVVVDGDAKFFENRLFDAQEKLFRTDGRTVVNIDSDLAQSERDRIENFLSVFGNFGYCRVDGRLADGQFHFLEFTPDAWIAPKGQFAMAFTEKGWSYDAVIAAVLSSADSNHLYQ